MLLRTARALSAQSASAGIDEVTTAELFEGFRIVTLPYVNARGEQGRVLALLLAPTFHQSPTFYELCAQAALDPRVVRADMSPFSRFDAGACEVVRTSLASAVADLTGVYERDGAIDSFTRQLSESYDTIDLLYTLGRSMRTGLDSREFLASVCDRLFATMSFRWLGVVFDQSPQTAARLRGIRILRGATPLEAEPFDSAALGIVRCARQFPAILSDVPGLCTDEHPQVLAQPITCKGRNAGVLIVGGKHGDDPFVSSYDSQLVEATGGYISAFADNIALYEDLHASFMGTVTALTAAIDAKDRYTFGHSERVAWMSRELALAAGFAAAEADRIHIAGLVHDVGKIGVPEAVLCKPGKLDDAEFALIKQHPEIGHRILRDIPGFADVLPGVMHHHERYDGRGYPHGLKGDDIPAIARVIAVADTFDAMSSNRSYRAALARDRVLAEIERSAGTQLDPRFASLVRSLDLAGFDALFEKYSQANAAATARAA